MRGEPCRLLTKLLLHQSAPVLLGHLPALQGVGALPGHQVLIPPGDLRLVDGLCGVCACRLLLSLLLADLANDAHAGTERRGAER